MKPENPANITPPMTVMFVARTWGGELAAKLRTTERSMQEMSGYGIKILERAGRTLKDQLVVSNPWENTLCPDIQNCQAHRAEGAKSCQTRSITYVNICQACKKEGIEVCYVGESARSLRERGAEHWEDVDDT